MLINIGTFINRIDKRNIENKVDKVLGLNINKDFMPTVANIQNVDISKYKLVEPDTFVFSGMQTGRDNTIRIGLNDTLETFVVSPAYTTFVVNEDIILPKYFYMIFLSSERDRLGSFLSDSSVRANLDWDRFCEIEFEIPSLEIQQKYVDVYNALVANQRKVEKSLEDLRLSSQLGIENLRNKYPVKRIGKFIQEHKVINNDLLVKNVKSLNREQGFLSTKRKINNIDKYKVIKHNDIVYPPPHFGEVGTIGIYKGKNEALVSPMYITFSVIDEQILPDYLFMWFKRKSFMRYGFFSASSSIRDTFEFEMLSDYEVPIPPIVIQESVINLFEVYEMRRKLNEDLKLLLKEICPVLIKGAIQESKGVI